MACSSLVGFHCGSTMCTIFALVSVRLVKDNGVSSVIFKLHRCPFVVAYPTAPVSMERSRTRILGLLLNSDSIADRCKKGTFPSIFKKRIPEAASISANASSVVLQAVKTILRNVREREAHVPPSPDALTSLMSDRDMHFGYS